MDTIKIFFGVLPRFFSKKKWGRIIRCDKGELAPAQPAKVTPQGEVNDPSASRCSAPPLSGEAWGVGGAGEKTHPLRKSAKRGGRKLPRPLKNPESLDFSPKTLYDI